MATLSVREGESEVSDQDIIDEARKNEVAEVTLRFKRSETVGACFVCGEPSAWSTQLTHYHRVFMCPSCLTREYHWSLAQVGSSR